ncbi:RnfABCDGE type electron transport complex subunit G [Fusobacterium sp. PH5-44]|uniref:RnfABCDGE type electron transport complex subunit G n=1 Tax=unclassified Fusobacterium TaxID=2648384 RepID=UPI003D259499
MKNKFIHYGLVLFIIAGTSAGILGLVNSKTKPVIDANNQKKEDSARIEVLSEAVGFDVNQIIRVGEYEFIPGYNDKKELVGYVVKGTSNGYGGPMELIIGISLSGKITGLNVLSQKETSNLGDRITGEAWRNSWKGRDVNYEFNKSVDAFAGATVSPTAVYNGIKAMLKAFEAEVKNNGK